MKSIAVILFGLLLMTAACSSPNTPKANNPDNKKAVANV